MLGKSEKLGNICCFYCALRFMSWHIYVTRYGDTDWFLVFLMFLTYNLSSKSLIGPKYFEIEGAPTFLASGTGCTMAK